MSQVQHRILVVDDTEANRDLMQRRLQKAGFHVIGVDSGLAALHAVTLTSFDAVLLDVMMPGLDGLETLRRLRQSHSQADLPIIMVTAKGEPDTVVDALRAGANDFVSKPIDFAILLARLSNQLARKHAEQELKTINSELEVRVRKRTEALRLANEGLSRSESRLRAVLDHAGDGVICFDARGVIRVFNVAATQIFGYGEEDIIGSEIAVLLPEQDAGKLQGVSCSGDETLAARAPLSLYARRRNGQVFPAEISLSEVNEGGDHLFILVLRDITERRRAEDALRKADVRERLLLDSVGDGVYGIDPAGIVVFINRSALNMLGYSWEECIGQESHALFHHSYPDGTAYPRAQCTILASFSADAEGNGAPFAETFWTKTGQPLSVEVAVRPLLEDDRVSGAVVSFRDVSERRLMEARLRQAEKMEAVGRLTGGVAHDFNNLLTVIMGNLQLLERQLTANDMAMLRLGKVLGAARSGAELTRRLLTFSRQQVLETVAIDLNEVVGTMEQLLARTLGEEIRLVTRLSALPCWAMTDRNQLENALLNLCINARDAMPDGGRLTIETRHACLTEEYAQRRNEVKPGNYIEIAVSDTGTGIPPDLLGRIFEPFFTTKADGKGTGLGLASIFGFMKQSKGHVSVYSEVGHGTTFRLYVPVASGRDNGAEMASGQLHNSVHRGFKILLVEDNENVREIAAALLEEAGFTIIEAEDGPSGLEAFKRHPDIHMIFTDVIMPGGMTGPQMVEHIRERRPNIPVLFASGYAEQALRDREGLLKSAGFVAKPYDVNELPRLIEALLAEAGQ